MAVKCAHLIKVLPVAMEMELRQSHENLQELNRLSLQLEDSLGMSHSYNLYNYIFAFSTEGKRT